MDYNKQNIIYNFKSDNTLVVSGDNSSNLGYKNGNYKYLYNKDHVEMDFNLLKF